MGNQIFGNAPVPAVALPPVLTNEEEELANSDGEDSGNESDTSAQSLIVALASTNLEDSEWRTAPAYTPFYLSTASEYLPPLPKTKLPANAQVIDPDTQDKNDPIWNSEAYENSLEIDNVFDKFAKRVSHESEQCLRWVCLQGSPVDHS